MVCSGVSFTLFNGDDILDEYKQMVDKGFIKPDTAIKYTESLEDRDKEEMKMQNLIMDLLKDEQKATDAEDPITTKDPLPGPIPPVADTSPPATVPPPTPVAPTPEPPAPEVAPEEEEEDEDEFEDDFVIE